MAVGNPYFPVNMGEGRDDREGEVDGPDRNVVKVRAGGMREWSKCCADCLVHILIDVNNVESGCHDKQEDKEDNE